MTNFLDKQSPKLVRNSHVLGQREDHQFPDHLSTPDNHSVVKNRSGILTGDNFPKLNATSLELQHPFSQKAA